MKYIITESKLEEIIVNYLNKMYDVNNIDLFHPMAYDDDEEWEDENTIIFYETDDVDSEDYDNECFTRYDCDYFDSNDENSKYCPIVSVDDKYIRILDGYFADKWVPVFKKWFEYHFHLPVKTIKTVD